MGDGGTMRGGRIWLALIVAAVALPGCTPGHLVVSDGAAPDGASAWRWNPFSARGQPDAGPAPSRGEVLASLRALPVTSVLLAHSGSAALDPMILLEQQDERLHFQGATGRRLGLRGVLVASLHGLGIDLVDVEYDAPPALQPGGPPHLRQLVTVDPLGRVQRTGISCVAQAPRPSGTPGIARLPEICAFPAGERENWFDLDAATGQLVGARQWVTPAAAVDFTLVSPAP
jgi:hypothetical protein